MLTSLQVLNKILQTKDYSIIKKNGFDNKFFKGYENEFDFINNHFTNFGNVPDMETFIEKFPDFELVEVHESDKYLVDKLYEEDGYNRFAPKIPELANILQNDSRDAYEYLMANLNEIKPQGTVTGVDIIKDSQERYDKYLERMNAPEKSVIKTGFAELDEIFHGWEFGEELITIIARINQGKSWLLMKFLAEAWEQGYRVGSYSGEMNPTKLGYRFDSLFKHYSNRCLTWGGQVDGYKDYIDTLKQVKNPFMITTQKELGGKATVPKLRRFVETNELEILGIDQFSLMDDVKSSSRDQNRLKMARISEDLFLLSTELKIPIIGLAQANRSSLDKDEQTAPGLENIKESDDIGANSSKVIGLRQAVGGHLILDVIKNREGKVGSKLKKKLKEYGIRRGREKRTEELYNIKRSR